MPLPVRRRATLAYAAVLAVLFVASALDRDGLRAWRRLSKDADRVERENARIERENAQLRREIRALQGDPAALERAAREDLGYVRPGEIILKLDDPGGAR